MLAPILEGPVHGQTPCLGVCVEAAYPGKECVARETALQNDEDPSQGCTSNDLSSFQ